MNQNEDHIAEYLLLQYLLGNLDKDERQRVDAWIEESESNRKVLDRLEALWLETGRLSPPPVAVDSQAAWEKISGRIDLEEKEQTVNAPGRIVLLPLFRWITGAAAVIVLSLGTWWLVNFLNRPGMIDLTAQNDVVRDTLGDGSIIALNANSTLRYPERFEEPVRKVHLSGEAFFEVTPDRSHPFVVDAGFAQIRVVGTAFNIKAIPESPIIVSVSEGTVLLFRVDQSSGDTISLLIGAGQCGIMEPGDGKPYLETKEDPSGLFWLNRSMIFHDTPLSLVFEEISKRYPVTITADNPAILNCRLTTTFLDAPVELMMKVISESFNLQVRQENQTYLFIGNGCSK